MNRRRLTAFGLAVTLSMTAAACGKSTEEPEEASAVAVEVLTPKAGELTVDTTYIGNVTPQEQVYVIPKASGTVTETFFSVGDAVQAGDVLFKIDDKAAQLQMSNARAAYASAQAGVTAQNGGARDLQNYQTEEQIRQLKDSLWKTDDQISDMEDSLDDVRSGIGGLNRMAAGAQADVEAAMAAYTAMEDKLMPEITELRLKVKDIEDRITEKKAKIESETDSAQKEILQKELEQLEKELEEPAKKLKDLELQLGNSRSTLDLARQTLSGLQAQIAEMNSTKTQIKSGIDQIESSQDTIRDNINMAEQAYAITQNEIYPQSDAVSAAQLQSASIAIDSAQMQLDFCTVTSPISGIVESVSVEKNGMAAAGNPAYIISNKESMTVTFQVAEKAKNVLQAGDHVIVEREGQTFDGVITEIGTMTNPQTRLFQVKAAVTGAGDALPNGVSVKVSAVTERESGKLIIPYDAIYFTAGDAHVYCVEDGKVVKTEVTVGLMSDTEAVIEEGLTADSLVISNWSSRLRNGVEAEIVSKDGEAVLTETVSDETKAETSEEEMPAEDTEGTKEMPAEDAEMTEGAE